jgi:hypothetical protein
MKAEWGSILEGKSNVIMCVCYEVYYKGAWWTPTTSTKKNTNERKTPYTTSS